MEALERDKDKDVQLTQEHLNADTFVSATPEPYVDLAMCSSPPNTIVDPKSSKPTTVINDYTKQPNKANEEGNSKSKSHTQNNDNNRTKICSQYKLHRCKFGSAGRGCPLPHPKVCPSYRLAGRDSKYGCPKYKNCEYYHPKICPASLNYSLCTNLNCPLLHLKGTMRFPPPTKESLPENINRHSLPQTQHLPPMTQQDFIITQLKEMQQKFVEVIKLIPWYRQPPQQQHLQLTSPAPQPVPQPPLFLAPHQTSQQLHSWPPLMTQQLLLS